MTTTPCQGRSRSECRVCVERRTRSSAAAARLCLLERELVFLPHLPYHCWSEADLPFDQWDPATVLDADTESLLFRQLNLAFYTAHGVRDFLPDSPTEVDLQEFRRLLERGEAIREVLVVVYGKLVVSVAASFTAPRFSLDELISEGQATLLRAIAGFDPDRGFRFSTYATHAIRRRLLNYLRNVRRVELHFAREIPDHAAPEDRRWTAAYERRVERALADVERLARQLTPRERYILRARFGWGREFEPRTLQQIADEFGISRERVRQLEGRALQTLRRLADEEGIEGL